MRDPANLVAPIPGMGLTSERGSRPWQRPPEFSTLEDAAPLYIKALGSAGFIDMFADSVEAGLPITTLADMMIQTAVMEGKHSIDVGILIAPLVVEMLITLAEAADMEYTSGLEELDNQPKMGKAAIRKAVNKMFSEEKMSEEQQEVREDIKEEVLPKAKGLMAKRGEE